MCLLGCEQENTTPSNDTNEGGTNEQNDSDGNNQKSFEDQHLHTAERMDLGTQMDLSSEGDQAVSMQDFAVFPPAPERFGGDRPARYVLPDNYDSQVPAPLVLSLHGFTGTANGQNQYFGLSQQTKQNGVILILPNGRSNPDGNQFWAATDYCCDFYQQGDDDVAYLLGLIEEAQTYFNIDRSRIALIGHSNGGFMSYRLACEASDVITHIVSLAGASWANIDQCTRPTPLSVLQIHGTLDLVIRYDGHQATAGDPNATWDLRGCWDSMCSEPQGYCAESMGCAGIWSCMNGCGWGAEQEGCRGTCYEMADPADQLLWVEEFACALNAGCMDDPAQANAGYSSAAESVQRWVERNGCAAEAMSQDALDLDSKLPNAETTRLAWTQCQQNTVTGLWTIKQGSHVPALTPTFSEQIIQWILEHSRAASNNNQ